MPALTLRTVFLLLAVLLFGAAAIGVTSGRLVPAGLALLALAELVP